MKLKTLFLLLIFPFISYSQMPCAELSVDFANAVTTETHFLNAGDTIFSQQIYFTETGTYSFYYQTPTGCDSLVRR